MCSFRSTYQVKITGCTVMMARPSDEPVLCPHVFGPQHLSGSSVNLIFEKASNEYCVMRDNGEGRAFTVVQFYGASRSMLVLQGPEKAAVALLEAEGYGEWYAYGCKSVADSEKIFSASKDGAQVHVSLAKKMSSSDVLDFQIKGSWSDRNCTIHMGEGSTTIVQTRPLENNNKVMVEIYPDVDHAFVVALIAIIDATESNEPEVCPLEVPDFSFCPLEEPGFSLYPTGMAQPSEASPVMGRKYISKESVNLMFIKMGLDEYDVIEISSKERVFNLKSFHTTFHKQWMLGGAAGEPVALLLKKKMTGHSRWYVSCFAIGSKADPKKVFSVCKDHMIQRHTDLNVILEKERGVSVDYKVKGSWTEKACTIYKGDSSTKMAQMHSLENKDNFMMEIYPNVDYAFVVAVVAVVAAMKSPSKLKVVGGHATDLAVKFAGGAACAAGQFLIESLL